MQTAFIISLVQHDNATWEVEITTSTGSRVCVIAPSAADGCLEALEALGLDKMRSHVQSLRDKLDANEHESLLMKLDYNGLLQLLGRLHARIGVVVKSLESNQMKADPDDIKTLKGLLKPWPPSVI